MHEDTIDRLEADWEKQRPELDAEAVGLTLCIQALARIHLQQASDRLGDFGLQWWQYDVLSVLRRQGYPFMATASELAGAAMLSTGAMTHRIDRLAAHELVKRVDDPTDRRKVLVQLTEKGLDLVEAASGARFEVATGAFSALDVAQKKELGTLLRLILPDQ